MRKTLFTCLLAFGALASYAQVDLSKYLLQNYGFDQDFDYKASQSNEVTQEIKDVKGWTANLSANYTIVGTYEYGFKGTFNTATVPAKGYNGEAGGGLAISTGWE